MKKRIPLRRLRRHLDHPHRIPFDDPPRYARLKREIDELKKRKLKDRCHVQCVNLSRILVAQSF